MKNFIIIAMLLTIACGGTYQPGTEPEDVMDIPVFNNEMDSFPFLYGTISDAMFDANLHGYQMSGKATSVRASYFGDVTFLDVIRQEDVGVVMGRVRIKDFNSLVKPGVYTYSPSGTVQGGVGCTGVENNVYLQDSVASQVVVVVTETDIPQTRHFSVDLTFVYPEAPNDFVNMSFLVTFNQ